MDAGNYILNTNGLLFWQLTTFDGLNVELPDSTTATVTLPNGSTQNPTVTLESGETTPELFLNALLLSSESGLYRTVDPAAYLCTMTC